MKVFKKLTRDYTVTPNEIHRHGLSLQAIGLYLYILSKPEAWTFSVAGINSQIQNGRNAINSAVKELEDLGFLVRVQKKSTSGRFSQSHWELHDNATKTSKVCRKRVNGKRVDGKSLQVSTKEVSTKRECGTHTLKLSKEDVDQLMFQYGVTGKALSKVGQKYRNWCDDKNKKLSLAGFKLFLTREHWETEDFQPDKQMEMQMRGEI